MPSVLIDLTPLRAVAIVVIVVAGYPLHELLHAAVLWLTRTPFDVELAPTDRPVYVDLLVGRAVAISPREEVSPLTGLVFALAPGILALPALGAWAVMLHADTISLASALFVGAWFVVFLPSALDWYQAAQCARRL